MRQIWKHRYQIMEKLGKGGTGQVYKVWDLHLDKEWAMKEMEEGSDMEVQMIKQLSCKAFPRIVDAFSETGKMLLVMDYIKGITLEEVLKKGPLEEKEVIKLAKQIAKALLNLHEETPVLLYMDLKPSNLILEEEGELKLVDLGSVMIKGKTIQVSGTPGFASPEQMCAWQGGRLLNEQSDIFSFGMLLFSMLTGRVDRLPVIDKGSRHGILIRRYNSLVSPALERIIEKCTRGMAERRYTSIRDVYRQLELWEKKLNKKRGGIYGRLFFQPFLRKEWQQEKSILCTQGKSVLYIAGRNMLIFILSLLCLGLWSYPASHTLAEEKQGAGSHSVIEENKEISASAMDEEGGAGKVNLGVIIRDIEYRKVLVREGGVWETKDNLLFEIPWEEIETDSCEITIFCKEEEGEVKSFYLQCQRKG